jgi:hypothetical protein
MKVDKKRIEAQAKLDKQRLTQKAAKKPDADNNNNDDEDVEDKLKTDGAAQDEPAELPPVDVEQKIAEIDAKVIHLFVFLYILQNRYSLFVLSVRVGCGGVGGVGEFRVDAGRAGWRRERCGC